MTSNPIFRRSTISLIICSLLTLLTSPAISVPISSTTQISKADGPQNSDNDNMMTSNYSSEITKFILIVISIVILVELIFWLFKLVNKMRGRNFSPNEGQVNDVIRVRNENGFDTASTAGSVDEYLPPYDGLSLPKYVESLEGSNASTVVGDDETNGNTTTTDSNESDESSVATVENRSERENNTTNSSNNRQSGVVEIVNNPSSLTSTQTLERSVKSEE
ncbi:13380_t:CDS:1 [Dentiscutata heterogama]|uniref:13380_t:CDS:1 n=1 Tax=Dentiscutata heterogama TaxID=1316150 RepID=A0ACA9LAL5_9GLOM|nr:13380_t:CDS:1 [Dentiscutata heterogama]